MIIGDDYLDHALEIINEEPNKALNLAQYKLYKRPKLRVNRLADEKKLVPIVLDVQINDKLIIRERFDWNLGHEHISVKEFTQLYVERLQLPSSNLSSIRTQILTQLIDYIERNTFFPRNRANKDDNLDEKIGTSHLDLEKVFEKTSQNFKENLNLLENKPIIKLTARQRTLETMKKANEMPNSNKSLFSKKLCRFCLNKHLTPVTECKNCRIPFNILEELNLKEKTIRLSLKYFEICAKNVILLTELGLHKELNPCDFQSVFILKNKLIELFKMEEDLIENKEIYEKSLVSLNDIHLDFLKGKYDEKDNQEENENNENEGFKSHSNLIKKEIRKRGRPRKYFHTRKYYIKKTYHP